MRFMCNYNSVEQSASSEADSFSASEDISSDFMETEGSSPY